MAIERTSKTFAFNTPPEEVDSANAEAQEDGMPEAPEGGESATIPLAMLGGQQVNPGDVVRLEVVSSDPESGMVTVKYAMPKGKGMM